MTDRAEIVRLLHAAYAARQRADIGEIVTLFDPAGCFGVAGGPMASGSQQCGDVIAALARDFEVLDYAIGKIVIEGETAVVHWHGRFLATATGRTGETDLLDLIEVKEGRIASMKTFFDTALAARLAGP